MKDFSLTNSDLSPIKISQRTWGFFTFFLLWAGLIIQVPTYMLVVALQEGELNMQCALLSVFFGSLLILVPIVLCSDPGCKYGISYPVFIRSVLGIKGAKISGALRIIIACGWFGIQTWIGSSALFYLFTFFLPALYPYFDELRYLCFLLFLLFNILLVYRGASWIRNTENVCSSLLIVSLCVLLFTFYDRVGLINIFTFSKRFSREFEIADVSIFFSSAVIAAGFWATLSVNMSDFTRYSRSSFSHIAGQVSGVLIFMIGFSFLALVAIDELGLDRSMAANPLYILAHIDSLSLKVLVALFILIATLTTNIAANLVGAANEISNLFPRYFSFKVGVFLVACISTLMMPWHFLSNNSSYLFIWLSGYASLLGPLTGIIIVDYFILKKRKLIVKELFKNQGRYYYWNGYNIRAIAILFSSISINIPGFMVHTGMLSIHSIPLFFFNCYSYAWFTGTILAGVLYFLTSFLNKETFNLRR